MATLAQLHEHYDLKTGSQNRAEKLLDKPYQPLYYGIKGVSDSKLVFDPRGFNDKIQ